MPITFVKRQHAVVRRGTRFAVRAQYAPFVTFLAVIIKPQNTQDVGLDLVLESKLLSITRRS